MNILEKIDNYLKESLRSGTDSTKDVYVGAVVKILRGNFKGKKGKVVDFSLEDDQVDVKVESKVRYLGFEDVEVLK